ncbi:MULTISPECIES: MarR family transcriptional regulator [unclassified Bradyrhizobium]|uniref:helix-turn-helix domain-containing protein n=1 Tax=unclassified Bradyrhizobium TaxID=2631580 RepID=UPI0028ECBC3F|nr:MULTISPECIES: winged helix DNA-binding protein [unclassified Bradyrhizobium]
MKRATNSAAKRAAAAAKTKSRRMGSTAQSRTEQAQGRSAAEAGTWHLARTDAERRVSDFEFALERLAQSYYRWKASCLAAVCEVPLTGDDVAVLNVVRMGDEPKRLAEVGQLLNRVDVPNLQYATRKLTRAGLIETEGGSSRKETRYRATAKGRAVTEDYAKLRAETLPPMFEGLAGWVESCAAVTAQLDQMSGLYAQATRVAITRRHQS